jgi:hypothetical protein
VSWLAAWLTDRRLRQEQIQNNERLRLEAAMQAGGLLASSAESVASPATAAAGLLALTKLDHTELAVALLVDLWTADPSRSSRICSETAILVIDAALRDTTASNAPLIAAELLCRHARHLNAAQSLHWPSSIDGGWRADFSPQTKLLIIDGLVTMTTTSEAAESALRSLVVRLYGVWKTDPDDHVKGCIALLLGAVKEKICRLGYTNFKHASFNVSLKDVEDATKSQEPGDSDEYLVQMTTDRAVKLKEWSERCVRSYETGALSNSNCERDTRGVAAATPA